MKMFIDIILVSSAILILMAFCGWFSWARADLRGEAPDVSMCDSVVGLLAAIGLGILWIVFGLVCVVRWIIQAS